MPRHLVRRAVARLRRAVSGPPAAPSVPVPPPLLGYVVAGADGAHPASAHVRVVRRAEHLAASGAARVRQVDPAAFVAGEDDERPGTVLVQRDVLPVALVEPFLRAARERGTRVVAEVDDDFFTASGRERLARAEYDPERLASIDTLVRGADLVVVSTPELADVVRSVARAVTVVPNALDPEIWTPGPLADDDDRAAGEHRVLYMGTLTHGDDLALLERVFTDLRTSDGTPVHLEVIGVTEDDDADWYRRLEVPDGHYPAFARWLVAHRGRWRAGVAPLRDEEFNRAKSDLKAIEYTALDLPAVVSDRPSYRVARDHGVVAVPDDVAAWRHAVVDAVESGSADPTALAWVRRERMLGTAGDTWRATLLG